VHTPIQAKPDDIRYFEQKAKALGLDKETTFAVGEPFPSEHKKHLNVTRRLLQSDPVYAAMVFNLDANIGRLLQALQETGKAEDTIVVFTSDNGGLATSEGSPTCNAPLAEGKGWMYDGGVRVPLLVRWPRIVRAGALCDTPVTSPDFFPTFLDAARIAAPPVPGGNKQLDGVSLVPLLEEQTEWKREALFWHYPHYGNQGGTPGSSVRIGPWKLIEFFEDNRLELYDLSRDEAESDNRASVEPERAARMQQILARWRQDVEAQIPAPNPDASLTSQ
jgi:arylsulfatase A-like enzyme